MYSGKPEGFAAVHALPRGERSCPGRRNLPLGVLRLLQVVRLERLFGAMKENSEVLTAHTKLAAHFVFVAFLKEQSFDQAAIFFRELVENLPNGLLRLPRGDGVDDTDGRVGDAVDDAVLGRSLPVS